METPSGILQIRDDSSRTRTTPKKQLARKPRTAPHPEKIARFIETHKPKTPFVLVDLDVIEDNFHTLRRSLPAAEIYYAVKANPAPDVVRRLVGLGSYFDVASSAEIDLVLRAGGKAKQISFGNTIKKEDDILYAFKKGVRLFAFDSEAELEKLSRSAPGARVFCRLLTKCEGAEWPLSRKFGCEPDMAHDLLLKARALGLEPHGISFHVGSQQTRTDQWDIALEQTAQLFSSLKERGITLGMVNIGGGFPARYKDPISHVSSYADVIRGSMKKHFGQTIPHMIIEPGRSLVGDAGILEAEVVLISKKSHTEDVRWVYLDIGKFGGLAETHDEAIKYRIETLGRKGASGPVILAGPSCDSVDILYEKFKYELPHSLKIGDRVRFHATGAYTSSYSSVGFNGFPPLQTYCI